MVELVRKGNEVYCGEKKLTIVKQETKGPGKEVVKIDGLEGSNGQKWVSLSKLKEGLNKVETQAREVTTSYHKEYELTAAEEAEVAKHKKAIEAIIEAAKARYVKKPKLVSNDDIAKMSQEQRDLYAKQLEAYIALVKGNK